MKYYIILFSVLAASCSNLNLEKSRSIANYESDSNEEELDFSGLNAYELRVQLLKTQKDLKNYLLKTNATFSKQTAVISESTSSAHSSSRVRYWFSSRPKATSYSHDEGQSTGYQIVPGESITVSVVDTIHLKRLQEEMKSSSGIVFAESAKFKSKLDSLSKLPSKENFEKTIYPLLKKLRATINQIELNGPTPKNADLAFSEEEREQISEVSDWAQGTVIHQKVFSVPVNLHWGSVQADPTGLSYYTMKRSETYAGLYSMSSGNKVWYYSLEGANSLERGGADHSVIEIGGVLRKLPNGYTWSDQVYDLGLKPLMVGDVKDIRVN